MIVSFLLGVVGHLTEKPIVSLSDGDQDTEKLTSYSVGVILILIAYIINIWDMLPSRQRMTAIFALCGSILGVGSGVVAAYAAEWIKNGK